MVLQAAVGVSMPGAPPVAQPLRSQQSAIRVDGELRVKNDWMKRVVADRGAGCMQEGNEKKSKIGQDGRKDEIKEEEEK